MQDYIISIANALVILQSGPTPSIYCLHLYPQYTLNGETAESFSPPYEVEEVKSIEVRILEKNGDASINDVSIQICCHPYGEYVTLCHEIILKEHVGCQQSMALSSFITRIHVLYLDIISPMYHQHSINQQLFQNRMVLLKHIKA